jgi:hypothetical protein
MHWLLQFLLWPVAWSYFRLPRIIAYFRPDLVGFRVFPPTVTQVLRRAESVEVYSIDPELEYGKSATSFHGWKYLGKTTVDGKWLRRRITRSVLTANWECHGGFKCLDPRHGIRVVSGGKTVDLLICFWCSQVEVFGPEQPEGFFPINSRPSALLNRLLSKAGIPQVFPKLEDAG